MYFDIFIHARVYKSIEYILDKHRNSHFQKLNGILVHPKITLELSSLSFTETRYKFSTIVQGKKGIITLIKYVFNVHCMKRKGTTPKGLPL